MYIFNYFDLSNKLKRISKQRKQQHLDRKHLNLGVLLHLFA